MSQIDSILTIKTDTILEEFLTIHVTVVFAFFSTCE